MAAKLAPLSTGHSIPMVGLGTAFAAVSISDAVEVGYRHIDTAAFYDNEAILGGQITSALAQHGVPREEMFITSKLWNTCHEPELVEPAVRQSLADLQLDYLDLYLIHFPTGYKSGTGLGHWPKDAQGNIMYSDVDYLDTWTAMEALVEKGLVRSIGVSNFSSDQIDRLLAHAKLPVTVNQIECHPYLAQSELVGFCQKHNIQVVAYAPLANPTRTGSNVVEDPVLVRIASKYGKTASQVALRYNVQRGVSVIPKTSKRERLVENIGVFDFELSPDDMAEIGQLNKNFRIVQRDFDHKYCSFPKPE